MIIFIVLAQYAEMDQIKIGFKKEKDAEKYVSKKNKTLESMEDCGIDKYYYEELELR